MNDLPLSRPNVREYTVSELSFALKRSIEDNFAFVRVRGEISGFKRHGSGHCYLALKDAEAVLDAVVWRATALRLGLLPEDGMEVVCTGRLTTYPGRSKYQLVVETIELAGVGALLKLLEERRQRLAAEGLFAADRKKKTPFLPELIGIVTSPSGAVIRDILHRLGDRFPRRVLLWPVAVQGEGAAAQVAAAIDGFNSLPRGGVPRPDLLIVARGGGSLEDLMPFNEEIVVRAAALSAIPLISAVGHETDTTLIDHASDLRAPTPSAAAEMAVPVRLDLLAELAGKGARVSSVVARLFGERRLHVAGLARGLPDPQNLIGEAAQRLDDRAERLRLAAHRELGAARQRLLLATTRLADPGTLLEAARRIAAEGFQRLQRCVSHSLDLSRERLVHLAARLRGYRMTGDIARSRERCDETAARLDEAALRALRGKAEALDNFSGRLATHSERHRSLLRRGYVVVRDAAARVVTEGEAVTSGAVLELEFHDAKVAAVAGRKVRRAPPQKPPPPGQGRLL